MALLYHFRDKGDTGRKSRFFHTPAFDAPVTFDVEKTRMAWLLSAAKSLRIRLAVLTQYRRVTDRRTDRRTDRHHSLRYVSRGKNT